MTSRFCLCLLLLPFTVCGQEPATEVCKPFASLQIPEAARPTLQQAVLPGGKCDPFDLYYSKKTGHFEKARFCGLAQLGFFREGAEPARAKIIQSAAAGGATEPSDIGQAEGMVLAMLFANGEGVQRNALAAKTFACNFAFSSQQADPSHMPTLLRSIDAGQHLDLCGDDEGAQGRSVWYACTWMRVGRAQAEIASMQKRVEHITAPTGLAALHALEAAWESFDTAQAKSFAGFCAGGTGCGVYSAQNELDNETKWLAQLKQIESGQLPLDLPPVSAYASIDNGLNETYRNSLKLLEGSSDAINDTKTAERSWLRYREAWVRFAAIRWPNLPADCWRAWLTQIRSNQFEDQN